MTSSPKRDVSLNQRAHSSLRRAIRPVACSIALFACALTVPATSAAAQSVDKMLNATPLVLKDGRIAEVSVHTIPFPDDAVAPASKVKTKLDTFTQGIATDCFLTAQVIGHVDKSEISGRETADIHRLARARADTIQTSLIDNGLPAASIASVWDWRFMVNEPRVTLWVFRLTAGEDCENTPLATKADDQIAAVAPAAQPKPKAAPEPAEPTVANKPKETEKAPVQQQIIPAARPKQKEITAPLPKVPSEVKTAKSDEKVAAQAPAQKIESTKKIEVASLAPSPEVDKKGSAGLADAGALEIVFATNSSFFPADAGDRLRAFMKTLDKGKSYVLRIQTSVDGDASVSGASSADDAQRYNAWLAERRFQRVEAWLLKNSDGRNLTIEPTLIENDSSRRVRIEPNPLG